MSDDPELAAIRAARLNQLKQQGSTRSPATPQSSQAPSGGDDAQRAAAEEEMRRNLLATVLEPSAGARSLANPERSRQIESILLRMAQTGQLRGRVSEEQLIELLEQAEEAQSKTSAKKATIVYQRRKELDDDDDFDI